MAYGSYLTGVQLAGETITFFDGSSQSTDCGLATLTGMMGAIARVNIHKNARLTPQRRLRLVRRVDEFGGEWRRRPAVAGISLRQGYRRLARTAAAARRRWVTAAQRSG